MCFSSTLLQSPEFLFTFSLFFSVPLLNSDIFQFSIWLSQPRREIHRIWKSFVQQSRKLLWSTHSLFGPLSGSNTTLTTFHATVHRIQQVTAILFRLSKKTSKHRTREGRKARDLILQQFATLVLHPAVNYVPFNATIMANGYRADKNTK